MTTITPGFRIAHAGGGEWDALVDECLDQLGADQDATLGFLYVTDVLADGVDDILARLRGSTGAQDWVGTVGFGVCVGGKEYFDIAAMVVLTCSVPADSYRILPVIKEPGEPLPTEIHDWVSEHRPTLAVVHGDPRNTYLPNIIDALCDDTECFLVGGLTASRGRNVQIAGEVYEGGLSGVLLADPDCQFTHPSLWLALSKSSPQRRGERRENRDFPSPLRACTTLVKASIGGGVTDSS